MSSDFTLFRDALSREAARLGQLGNHDATIHSQKDSLELLRFLPFHRTRRRLCTLKPASATYGAKLLLRKVPQYMGHSAVCQVGRRSFFYDDEVGLRAAFICVYRTYDQSS